jgi:hypothetical protein
MSIVLDVHRISLCICPAFKYLLPPSNDGGRSVWWHLHRSQAKDFHSAGRRQLFYKKNRCQHMPIKLFRTIRITSAQQYHQAYRASLHLRSVFCLCSLVLMVSFGEPEEECIICCSLLNVSSTREQILYPAVVNRSKAKENCRSPHRFQAKHFHSALEMRTVA